MNGLTIDTIIAKVDSLEPNQYDTADKIRWLSTLDGRIFEEIIMTHDDIPKHEHIVWRGNPLDQDIPERHHHHKRPEFEPYTSVNDELIAYAPYGDELYTYYLQAMIAFNNAEVSKYNQRIVMFNSQYSMFAAHYNRTHKPRSVRRGNRFLF